MKKVLVTLLTLVLTIGLIGVVPVSAKSKTIKMKKTAISLEVGKTSTLKLSGATKSKISWAVGDKTIATVSSKGKVKAKKVGNTTVYAFYKNEMYKCSVTVREKDGEGEGTYTGTTGRVHMEFPDGWQSVSGQAEIDSGILIIKYEDSASLATYYAYIVNQMFEDPKTMKYMQEVYSSDEDLDTISDMLAREFEANNYTLTDKLTTLSGKSKNGYKIYKGHIKDVNANYGTYYSTMYNGLYMTIALISKDGEPVSSSVEKQIETSLKEAYWSE